MERPQQGIDIGHCHTLPQSAFKGMVYPQVAREVCMAQMVREHGTQGLILLAGNSHLQKKIGVYHLLITAELARTQDISHIEDASDASKGLTPRYLTEPSALSRLNVAIRARRSQARKKSLPAESKLPKTALNRPLLRLRLAGELNSASLSLTQLINRAIYG